MPSFEDLLLTGLLPAAPLAPAKLCVAFSGGLDSTALLLGLVRLRPRAGFDLRAVHVDHGLHPDSANWAEHCARVCAELGVPAEVRAVSVEQAAGQGLEAAARSARYAALQAGLAPGEWLLTAHHADDQLETVLLHLTRGSGVAGLAGIPRVAPFGAGWLLRPCLLLERARLLDYVQASGRPWIEDPSNQEPRHDRNYLRREIVPRLLSRWPAIVRSTARSASLAAEAAELLLQCAVGDASIVLEGHRIPLAAFRELGDARQRNLLRYLARQRGWSTPPEARLRAGLDQLLNAGADRSPVVRWPGGEIRRYRDQLYLVPQDEFAAPPTVLQRQWSVGAPMDFGRPAGRLRLERTTGEGLSAAIVDRGLTVSLVAAGGDRSTLKHVFQRAGVVPWMRPYVPLVRANGELVAVGDLWIARGARAVGGEAGFVVLWDGHPPVF